MKFWIQSITTKGIEIPVLWFWTYKVGKNEILDAINVW
jgi:hypothetical protein